jgi:hypothetical protein
LFENGYCAGVIVWLAEYDWVREELLLVLESTTPPQLLLMSDVVLDTTTIEDVLRNILNFMFCVANVILLSM